MIPFNKKKTLEDYNVMLVLNEMNNKRYVNLKKNEYVLTWTTL